MTLRETQSDFVRFVPLLIGKARTLGFEVTFGGPHVPCEHNVHAQHLALDLTLFIDGVALSHAESYRPLGEWWESKGGTWGGCGGSVHHYAWPWQ